MGQPEETTQHAVEVAEQWLAMVDAGNYDKSWTKAASLFQKAIPQEQWVQRVSAVRDPIGTLKSRKVDSSSYETSLPGAPDGEYVVIQFASSFEHKTEAVETVTPMLDSDGEWRVSGYFIK